MASDPVKNVFTHLPPSLQQESHEQVKDCSEEARAAHGINFSVDLVLAAKRYLGLLRNIDSLPCLHGGPAVTRAIQRYEHHWLPLVADALKFDSLPNSNPRGKSLLPPIDVQWIWLCHCLNPVEYRKYCTRRYGRVIDYPVLPDVASEVSAQERCKKLWTILYPKEPFDILATLVKLPGRFGKSNEAFQVKEVDGSELARELVPVVEKQSSFYYQVSKRYMWEDAFLSTAKERYKCFLHVLRKYQGKVLCVPTFDIELMWHAHQQVPVAYARDTEAIIGCVVDQADNLERRPGTKFGNSFEDTAVLWETVYGHPYEQAGTLYSDLKPVKLPAPPSSEVTGSLHVLERAPMILPWDFRSKDENATKYPILTQRHVSQVCVMIKGTSNITSPVGMKNADLFIRMRALESYKMLKLDALVAPTNESNWQKLWILQCEAKTKGVLLELRYHADGCLRTLRKTKRMGGMRITWSELQRMPMLSHEVMWTLGKKRSSCHARSHPLQLRLGISMTPPALGSYLLKSVPDRVTDDKGQMLSSTIVRMRRNQPQSGRWVSRTVLNHAGKENFVIRIRAAKGVWKKNGDRPVGVDWDDRIINVHEGGWNYVANGIGIASEKIIGTAKPKAHELEEYKLSWTLSTGDTLVVSRPMGALDWERHLEFALKTPDANAGLARLVNGRKLQYEVPGATSEEEDGFVTLIRYSSQCPLGRATALFNFKVSIMEVVPEEDVLLVLLLCTAILRSVADFGGLTAGNVYTRRRAREKRPGLKDWGSVVLENGSKQSPLSPWHTKCAELSDDDTEDGENLPGRIAADWGGEESLPASLPGSLPGSRRIRYLPPAAGVVHEVVTPANTGIWGRRTGSGIQLDR